MNGEELNRAIHYLGLTQRSFAYWIGRTPAHVNRMIKGTKHIPPHLAVLIKVALYAKSQGVNVIKLTEG